MQIYNVNDRVMLHPATDDWMKGDRYGTIVHISPMTPIVYTVRLDTSERVRKYHEYDVILVPTEPSTKEA